MGMYGIPGEHVVLWLLELRRLQPIGLGDPDGLGYLLGTPLRGAPGGRLPTAHHIRHGAHHSLGGRQGVESVTEHQVDVVQLQALQGRLHPLQDVLARQPGLVNSICSPEYL